MAPLDFSDETEVGEIARIIADAEDERILLLAGWPGSGRGMLLVSGVEQARREGVRVLHATVDLDGYEPDSATLADFAAHLKAKLGSPRVVEPVESGGWGEAVRVAAALGCDAKSQDLALRLADGKAKGLEALDSAAGGLAEGERLVLHLLDGVAAPWMLRRRLLEFSDRHAGVCLAISCHAQDGEGKIVRSRANARFEVMPLDPGETAGAIKRLLGVQLGEAEIDQAYRRTRGLRGRLSALASQISAGELERNDVAASLEQLPADERKLIESFLHLAALCGENIPVNALLGHLGVDEEQIDEWIDRIDETVGADSEPALFADRFSHPAFPGETVYGFRDPSFAAVLRETLSPAGQIRLAGGLLGSFQQRIRITTRAAARLFSELCRYADNGPDRMELERELAWWVGADEADGLREELSAEVRAGLRSFEQVWMTANAVQFRWPPTRTLAVLDSALAAGAPRELEAAYHTIRCGLLINAGRLDEAEKEARNGLDKCSDRMLESALLERLGAAIGALGRHAEAEAQYAKCRSLREQLLDEGDPRAAPAIEIYIEQLRQAGHVEEADRLAAKLESAGSAGR